MAKRKLPEGANRWLKHLKKTFEELRKQDPTVSYKEAMVVASSTFVRK